MVENITFLSIKYQLIILCKLGLSWESNFDRPCEVVHVQFKFRPAYCNGQCSMLNHDTVHKIHEVAKQTDRNGFRLEGGSEKYSKFSIFLTENFRCLFHGITTPKSRNWTWRWARIGYGLLRRSRKSIGYRDCYTIGKIAGYRELQPYQGRSQAMKLIPLISLPFIKPIWPCFKTVTHPADLPLVYKFAKSIYSRFFSNLSSKMSNYLITWQLTLNKLLKIKKIIRRNLFIKESWQDYLVIRVKIIPGV